MTGTTTIETISGSVTTTQREPLFTEQGIQDMLWIEATFIALIGIIAFILNLKNM